MMTSKRIFMTASVAFFLGTVISVMAQSPDRIVGNWQDAKNPKKQVRIYQQGNEYFGKAMPEPNAKQKDKDKLLFKNLVWDSKKSVYKGTLINPEGSGEFKVEVKLLDKDRFEFKAGKFPVSRTFQFKRIS